MSMKGEFDSIKTKDPARKVISFDLSLLLAILLANPSFACNLESYRSSSTTLRPSLYAELRPAFPRGHPATSIFHLTRNQGPTTGIPSSLYFTSWPCSAIYTLLSCQDWVGRAVAFWRYLLNLAQRSLIYLVTGCQGNTSAAYWTYTWF